MNSSYNVVCIGGGLAGAAVALKMAEGGASVLVLEKTHVFTDRVRGEWLAPWGVREARMLGLGDVLAEAGSHELPALAGRSLKPRPITTVSGDTAVTYSHPALQNALLNRAERAGARVIRGARVMAVKTSGLATIEYSGPDGPARVVANMAVGADGRSSLTRQALGRESHVYRSNRALAGVRLADVAGDESVGYFILGENAGGVVSLFPQGNGFARAYVFEEGTDPTRYRGAEGFGRLLDAMVRMGLPRELVAGARAAGPLAAFAADDTWVRHPAGNGLALVGDAAGVSDPTWGMGTALLLRDARVLSEFLLSRADWRSALRSYARRRDRYYQAIITAERWLTEIQLSPGEAAAERRQFLMGLWAREPDRAIDLPGRGPETDISERARTRTFGEDVVSWLPVRPKPLALAERFIGALRSRDFASLRGLFSDTARMRMLLPGGPQEVHGADSATQALASWFQDVESFEPLEATSSTVADRLHMSWRCRIRWAGEKTTRLIEQQVYAKVVDGQLAVVDLLCSGFRVESDECMQSAA